MINCYYTSLRAGNYFGFNRVFDGVKYGGQPGSQAAAISEFGANPYVQMDFNQTVDKIFALKIWADSDCCPERMSDIKVFLSNDPVNYASGVACGPAQSVAGKGEVMMVPCTLGMSGAYRYVTIERQTTAGYISMIEAEVVRMCECQSCC